jgi:hypothetical protein
MNPVVSENTLKCVTMMVFEEKGKTILQPIIRDQEIQNVHELFQKNMLEVWLPNGRPDFAHFDVGILEYKQMVQPSKTCSTIQNRECLKKHVDTITSCKQYPLTNKDPQTQNGKHASFPT